MESEKAKELSNQISLRRSVNAYKIKSQLNKKLNESEEVQREIRFILNKLTPTNMQKLINSLLLLPITKSKEYLEDLVNTIISKALNEPLYSETYAQLCKILSLVRSL